MIAFGILVAVVAGVAWLGHEARKPWLHKEVKASELEKYLETLLSRGRNGSVMFIRGRGEKDAFLQFAKRTEGGRAALQFAFPSAPWSAGVYGDLKTTLRDNGFRAIAVPAPQEGPVNEFLVVDCGTDLDTAQAVAELSAAKVLAAEPAEAVLVVHFQSMPPL